jgi:hypothetical protein
MQRSIVPQGDREEYRKRVRDRKAHFERNGCKYWSFEEVGLPGAMLEFVEAGDEQSLHSALKAAPGATGEHARVYRETE